MKKVLLGLLALVGWTTLTLAQTNPTPQSLPYSQSFSSFTGTGSSYPAGWQGWAIAGSTSTSYSTAAPSGDQVLATGATAANSAVSAFVGDAVGKIAFLSTSSAMKSFVLALNTSGASSVQVQYVAATQRQQLNNRIGGMGLQYRVGTTGTFTNVATSEYQNNVAADNVTGTGSVNPQTITVTLPADCNNQPIVQIRWVYREVSGGGNRPGFSVTNVQVSAGAAPPPAALTASSINDFGSITVGQGTASQTVNLNGTNLTGAPGNLTVSSSSSSFQVSANNSSWSGSAAIPFASGTLTNGPLYVRFFPQAAGPLTGTISITGGGLANPVTFNVSGTGLPPSQPTLSVGSLAGFGAICLNTSTGPNSFSITGTNLVDAEIEVGPLTGYTFAVAASGPFEPSLLLAQSGGDYSQTIFVRFLPTAVLSYNGNIPVTGGGASAVSVSVTGAGVNTTPSLTTGAASAITTNNATLAGSISAIGCTSVGSYGIEYSLTNNFVAGTGIQVAASNLSAGAFSASVSGLTPSTTVYYRAYAVNAGGTGYGAQQSFTTAAPPPPVVSTTVLPAIGDWCLGNTSIPVSFTITGTNLTNAPIVVTTASPTLQVATGLTGSYATSISINQSGGSFSQVVFVRFTPDAVQSFNSNISITGAGLTNPVTLAVTAAGINTLPAAATGTASNIATHSATITGAVTANGCAPVTRYGIEYSSIRGLPGGQGTQVVVGNTLPAGTFSVSLTGLIQNSTYYYRTFATSLAGTSYSTPQSFTTAQIPGGLRVYNNPVSAGGSVQLSLGNVPNGNYAFRFVNMLGQVAYQYNIMVTTGFVDNTIPIPSKLPRGRYVLQVIEQQRGVYVKTSLMIQ
jgi:hypothetical protein